MKAALLTDYGPAENFRIVDIPAPVPGPGEALIKVAFAGLRWGDIMGRNGVPVKGRTPPFVPGQEAAGTVHALGEGVTGFAPGDRVYCLPQGGAYQEYFAISAKALRRVPDRVSLEQVLIYAVNLPTAYLAVFEWAKVQEGEIVLVHAAAGGVGSLAVQVLKRRFRDVTVIGLAGSDEKVALVRANGADHAINYKTTDYVEAVGEIAGVKPQGFAPGAPPAGVHVVLNGVGGSTLKTDRRVIRKLGRWVLYGGMGVADPVNLFANSYDAITIMPFSKIPFIGTEADRRAEQFTRDWMETERLDQPAIHPLEDIAAVQAAMERGETMGKVVFRL
ncbi:MAG: zinc-binding dehydrogenase [Dehalococcoidia bacterium]|nr:zinc-binding dehydrogenase [Dehalococcoidia bacterium]MCL4232192.1 zinc-binding dehydrogenase [Dehalococcoidia bacterium]NUQ54459.1 zinc-binding dehydrogenase [Dehalococcoidia bacterium]